jgi:hypothetical protein
MNYLNTHGIITTNQLGKTLFISGLSEYDNGEIVFRKKLFKKEESFEFTDFLCTECGAFTFLNQADRVVQCSGIGRNKPVKDEFSLFLVLNDEFK